MTKAPLKKKVARALDQLVPTLRDATLGVAVSGGADSVALADVLVALAPQQGFRVHLLHVHHGLRRESDEEQQFVASLCQRWQVALTVERLIPPPKQTGIEAWAREARYGFFRRMYEDQHLTAVVLAHTHDDQAETVLFRCLRGSARRGLAGIPPSRDNWIIRPLLACSREEVLGYLATRNLSFRIDSINTDMRYMRNRIRHQLLPLLEREFSPRIRQHLVDMANVFREEEEWMEGLATMARSRAQESDVVLSLPRLAIEPAVLQMRILRQWIESHRAVHDVTSSHLNSLRALVHGRSRVKVDLPGSMCVRREGIYLLLEEKSYAPTSPPPPLHYCFTLTPGQEIDIPQGGWRVKISPLLPWEDPLEKVRSVDLWQAVFDMDASPGTLQVRSFRAGDRIVPLGLGGKKKVQDVFVDAKVPRMLRNVLPLIEIGGELAWIPGCVRGEVAKISATTRYVCRAEVIPLPEKQELC